jgi:hypothetical protein
MTTILYRGENRDVAKNADFMGVCVMSLGIGGGVQV